MSRWHTVATVLIGLALPAASPPSSAEVVIRNANGVPTVLYHESYALVIGAADYKNDASWHDLPRVRDEVEKVITALKREGFQVESIQDPTGEELRTAIRRFVVHHGSTSGNKDNRLLIFFSGHGHTRPNDRGYLVPVDAPDPFVDEAGFLDKALDMLEVDTLARRIEAKHALFVFDSCFSGTLFKTRAPARPGEAYIRAMTAEPVRQFITAGSAGQEVPAASIFTPQFLKGVEGEADTNGDGYVTGLELGLYLMQTVPDYNPAQTPQYGKIRDPELDSGDFVFGKGKDPSDQLPPPYLREPDPMPSPEDLQIGRVSAKLDKYKYIVIEILGSVSDGDHIYIVSPNGGRTDTVIERVNTPVDGKGVAYPPPSSMASIEVGYPVFLQE